MTKFQCEVCGQFHDLSDMAIALQKPFHYFQIPEAERAARIKISEDVCSIDDEQFLIRGVMEMPLKGTTGTFDWGLWALVAEPDFRRYLQLWDAEIDPNEPPMGGILSGNPPGYPEANLTELSIYLRSGGLRPSFKVVDPHQRLATDQREGISLASLHPLIERLQNRG